MKSSGKALSRITTGTTQSSAMSMVIPNDNPNSRNQRMIGLFHICTQKAFVASQSIFNFDCVLSHTRTKKCFVAISAFSSFGFTVLHNCLKLSSTVFQVLTTPSIVMSYDSLLNTCSPNFAMGCITLFLIASKKFMHC